MIGSPRRQEDDGPCNVFWSTELKRWVALFHVLNSTAQLQHTIGHLGWEETRCNGINTDMSLSKLDSQVLRQVDDRSLRSRVSKSGVVTERSDSDTRNRCSDDNLRWVVLGGLLLEQWCEFTDSVEDSLHVKVHNLGEMLILVLVEWCSPGCAGVGEEDVDVVGGLGDLLHEGTDAGDLRGVGWDGDGFCAWLETWEGVEGCASLFARGGFARGDVDFRSPGLQESVKNTCQRNDLYAANSASANFAMMNSKLTQLLHEDQDPSILQ